MYSESIYKMSKLLEQKVLIYLRVIAKSQGVWGSKSEGIKGVYRSSKHRVRGKHHHGQGGCPDTH